MAPKELDKGEETISATIYRRESATESFRFVNTIGTTVFIENDPNVKIFYVNITHELDTPNSIRVRNGSGVHYEAAFLQPEIERGISYEFTVLDFSHPGLPDGGRSRIDGRPISVTRATHPVRIDVEKNIRGVIMGRSDISDLPDFAELRAQQRAMISAITGRAQVVVRLSPEN